jgi:hypothetical protein
MKQKNAVLATVLILSLTLAWKVADMTRQRQAEIAVTRDDVRSLPIAGFQKFAADIHWLLIIQYGGSHDVNEETADEFYRRVMRIIELDPDFARAYETGVSMLGPVAPEKALAIADKAMAHPRLKQNWRLALQAGQLVMQREKAKLYRGEPMSRKELERAERYFLQAMSVPGAGAVAQRSYVRVLAAKMPGNDPLELKEIRAWYDYWKHRRRRFEFGELGRGLVGGDEGSGTSISEVLLTQLRVARRRYPDNANVNKEIDRVLKEAFPHQHLDPVALMPYDPGDRYSPHSGVKVDVYGVCKSCGLVLKGRYCHGCGEDSAASGGK